MRGNAEKEFQIKYNPMEGIKQYLLLKSYIKLKVEILNKLIFLLCILFSEIDIVIKMKRTTNK